MDSILLLTLLTIGRILIGAVLVFVLFSSLHQFKRTIMSLVTVLLVSNVFCLYLLVELL